MSVTKFTARIPELTRNLLRLWRVERTEADTAEGADWYPQAHRIMLEWADHYGYSIATVACVTSALSPQCSWPRNLIIADDILANRVPSIGALKANVTKATAIRDARASTTLGYFKSAPKVASFAANLMGDYSLVTVDTHMIQAALADVEVVLGLKWSAYEAFATAYVNAAHAVDVEPAIFQAVLWHTWKRLFPPAAKRARRRQWDVVGEF